MIPMVFKKRAEVQSEVFVYILAVVVIGMLLILGIRYIGNIMTKVEDINLLEFKTDLESAAQRIAPSYGTWEKLELSVPNGVSRICFVEPKQMVTGRTDNGGNVNPTGLCTDAHADYDFRMCNAWNDDPSRNVYTEPFDVLSTGIYIGPLDVIPPSDTDSANDHYLCFSVAEDLKLRVKFIGMGDSLKVQPW